MSLEREKTEIPCPGGGSPIRTTYGDLVRKRTKSLIEDMNMNSNQVIKVSCAGLWTKWHDYRKILKEKWKGPKKILVKHLMMLSVMLILH